MTKPLVMFFVLLSMALGACSTIEGAGHDLSDAARWTREQISAR